MSVPENFDQQIFRDKLKTLYSINWISTGGTLTVGLVYVFLQLPYHSSGALFAWYGFLIAIYICRFFLTKKFLKEAVSPDKYPVWLHRFRIAIFVTAMTLGSTVLFFYPTDNVPRQMFTVLVLAGMASGGLTLLVSDLVSFILYETCLILPVIISSFIIADSFYLAVGSLLIIYFLILLRASRALNDIVTSSLRLRYENLSLVASLEQEKHQLNNRLGRILNDSSNELYIVDAESLNCIQFNKGAMENLGYSQDELASMNLHDIIVDLNKQQIKELIEPLRIGLKESITYKTLQQRRDRSNYPVEIRFQLSTQEQPPVLVVTALDISERDEAERKLIHQANYDQLTNLPNRYYMLSRVGRAFARARRRKTKVSLLYLDLNNFKDINDTLGHGIGDKLLKLVAERVRSLLREVDTAARLGGDEFLVMLEGLQQQDQAEVVVHKIINSFNDPYFVDSNEIYTSASIGISTYPDDGNTVEMLMRYADTAMYHAKQDPNSDYHFFSHELRAYIDEQLAIENRLRHALKNNELSLYYQPKIRCADEQIVGAEALLRWHNPELGNIPPNVFIPVAEKYGLIESIGSWVLRTACKEASTWKDITPLPLHVAVNISPRQFRSSDFLEVVDDALRLSSLPPQLLEVEITESLLMQDTGEPLEILQALQDRNITLSLDDFGTGYSSLSYLKRFPLQILKIDRSFIQDMMENQHNMSLVDAIISMAQSLDLQLVAEGVETRDQLSFLRKRSVEVVQGYLFSPPVPTTKFRALLKESVSSSESYQQPVH